MPTGSAGKHLADQRDRRLVARAGARRLHRAQLGLRARVLEHRARQHVLRLGVRRHAEARHVDADDANAVDLLRQEPQRHAGGGRHAEIGDDDGVVVLRVGKLEHRLADVLEQLAGDERLGVERHVADGAARAVEVRGEGEAVDAARGARQDRRGAPHAQADAQRAEGRAHALRLVVRPGRIVGGVAIERFALAGGRCGAPHLVPARMAADPVTLGRGDVDRNDLPLAATCLAVVRHRRRGRVVIDDFAGGAGESGFGRGGVHGRKIAGFQTVVVDDFERLLLDFVLPHHVERRRRLEHDVAADCIAAEQAEQTVLGQRLRSQRRRLGDVGRELLEQRRPLAAGAADDFVVGALAADVVVRGNRRQHRDADRLGERLRLAGAVVLVDDQAGDADIAAELAEILDRRADVVGDVRATAGRSSRRRSPSGTCRARSAGRSRRRPRRPGNRAGRSRSPSRGSRASRAVSKPWMMPRPPQPRPDLGPAELHREDAVALEADVADRDLLAGELLLRRGLDDGRARAAAEQQRGRVALGVAADQQHLLALLRHHVGEVGEREALADAALAVDRDDLRRLSRPVRWAPDRARSRPPPAAGPSSPGGRPSPNFRKTRS